MIDFKNLDASVQGLSIRDSLSPVSLVDLQTNEATDIEISLKRSHQSNSSTSSYTLSTQIPKNQENSASRDSNVPVDNTNAFDTLLLMLVINQLHIDSSDLLPLDSSSEDMSARPQI